MRSSKAASSSPLPHIRFALASVSPFQPPRGRGPAGLGAARRGLVRVVAACAPGASAGSVAPRAAHGACKSHDAAIGAHARVFTTATPARYAVWLRIVGFSRARAPQWPVATQPFCAMAAPRRALAAAPAPCAPAPTSLPHPAPPRQARPSPGPRAAEPLPIPPALFKP